MTMSPDDASIIAAEQPTTSEAPVRADPLTSAQPSARLMLLGTVRNVRCSVAITPKPWELGLDTIVISAGVDGYGRLGAVVFEAVGLTTDLRTELRTLTPDAPVHIDLPYLLPPSEESSAKQAPPTTRAANTHGLMAIVVASVRESLDPSTASSVPPASIEAAGRAAAASVSLAASHGAQRIGVPLLGAGTAGLDLESVADELVPCTKTAIVGLAEPVPLNELVFLADADDVGAAIVAAWHGYRSQPLANDRPEGPDLLGIRDEVHALADMLLLREVQAPLAVGILGGWGSGKSFVMHLMRERLNEVRAEILAEKQTWAGQQLSPFVGHLYPIEFNAWTYARADLWAALMQTVLGGLDRQIGIERRLLARDGSLLDGSKWKRLLDVPDDLHALYDAEFQDDDVNNDLFTSLAAVHKQDREALEKQQEHLAGLRTRAAAIEVKVETQVDDQFPVAIEATRWQPFRKLLAGVVDATEDEVCDWIQKLPNGPQMLGDGASTTQDARALVAALRELRPPDRKRARKVLWTHRIAGLTFAATALAAPILLVALREKLGAFTLSAGLLSATAAIGSFLRLASAWTAVGHRFATYLADWQRAVERDIGQIEAARAELVAVKKQNDPELQKVRSNILTAEQEVERLRGRAELVGQFHSVGEVVAARLAAGTYQERLGVMQQIADDLASLSRSLTVAQPDMHEPEKRKVFPRGPARVVLFIDDLDRCPPPKVVEVLEAVQLLLATNLFVVVVALDVRYVTKALERVYEGVLVTDGDPSGLDYLEKIIQIPYRTRSMTVDAAQRFLAGQVRVAETKGRSRDRTQAPAATGPSTSPVPVAPDPHTTDPAPTPETIARELLFSEEERRALAVCCAALELTPRAAKRVVNVTKLFRMVWARRGKPSPRLEDTATVALLVALAAAHPEVQRDALAHVERRSQDPVAQRDHSLAQALLELPAPGAGAGTLRAQLYDHWRTSVEEVLDRVVFDSHPDGSAKLRGFRLGSALLDGTGPTISFVSAFCFVADHEVRDSQLTSGDATRSSTERMLPDAPLHK